MKSDQIHSSVPTVNQFFINYVYFRLEWIQIIGLKIMCPFYARYVSQNAVWSEKLYHLFLKFLRYSMNQRITFHLLHEMVRIFSKYIKILFPLVPLFKLSRHRLNTIQLQFQFSSFSTQWCWMIFSLVQFLVTDIVYLEPSQNRFIVLKMSIFV